MLRLTLTIFGGTYSVVSLLVHLLGWACAAVGTAGTLLGCLMGLVLLPFSVEMASAVGLFTCKALVLAIAGIAAVVISSEEMDEPGALYGQG